MPPARLQKTSSGKGRLRRNVASKVHLNDKATSRSIAYAAVQVCPFLLRVILRLSAADSCTLACKLQLRGPQSTEDLTTWGCITTWLIFLTTLLGRLRSSALKN